MQNKTENISKIIAAILMVGTLALIIVFGVGGGFIKLDYTQRISKGIANCQKIGLNKSAEQLVCRVDNSGKAFVSNVNDLKFGDIIVTIINTPVILSKSQLSVLNPTTTGITSLKLDNNGNGCVLVSNFNFEEGKFFIQPESLKDYMIREKGYDYICQNVAKLKEQPIIFGGMLSNDSIQNPNAILATLYLPNDSKTTEVNSLDFFNNQKNYSLVYYFAYKIKK